ncbi:MAG: TPR end-of-group domain-containing protein [Pirellulaceae bacterium]
MERTIDDVVETVLKAKEQKVECTLLIGAGCSAKANIPLASGFVKIVREEWPAAYKQAEDPKGYAQCMAELAPSLRRALIAKYIDQAKINWAHIAIAQLIKNQYVHRVLTTNFDPLVVRACALVGAFPAVYDFAASQVLKPADIPGEAVFYLHGQRTGFALMNTKKECGAHSKLLKPLFQDSLQGRVWVVVGYSGENDPVFAHLAKVPTFDNNLYWVGYKDQEPAPHVRKGLLTPGKYAFFVKGFDADDFFVTLTQRLGCFPPDFVNQPFTHLDGQFDLLVPYKDPNQDESNDVTARPRSLIRSIIEQHEKQKQPPKEGRSAKTLTKESLLTLQVTQDYMAGDYGKVLARFPDGKKPVPEELTDIVTWAYVTSGNMLSEQAKSKPRSEADQLLAVAVDKYQAALKIKPDKHEALLNWGLALVDLAKMRSGAEMDRLFALAMEKYEAALQIKPDKHEALNDWGLALSSQAKTKSGAEADRLFAMASEKFKAALKLKPDKHEALNNWGISLSDQAKMKSGPKADRLFALAAEKFGRALKIKPDKFKALDNWGIILIDQAKMKSGAEADRLLAEAREKCIGVEAIVPGEGAYNLACISAMQGKEGDCKDWLNKCKAHETLPGRDHLLADADLANFRDKAWFQELIAK